MADQKKRESLINSLARLIEFVKMDAPNVHIANELALTVSRAVWAYGASIVDQGKVNEHAAYFQAKDAGLCVDCFVNPAQVQDPNDGRKVPFPDSCTSCAAKGIKQVEAFEAEIFGVPGPTNR